MEWSERISAALSRPAAQQPPWPDPGQVRSVSAFLATLPPLVTPEEIRALRRQTARVARGEAFLLQGGDCAETFDAPREHLVGTAATLLRMAAVLAEATGTPVVPVGRLAGQYAKPRSDAVDGLGLPVYRGDIVNAPAPDPHQRIPDPVRMIQAHRTARAALDLLRTGRFTGVHTSHEALLLDYERPQLTVDPTDGLLYGGSAHLLWIGERTRRLDGAHVAFAELIANPVAVKLGPGATPAEAAEYAERLDPHGEPGRLTLISRMGSARVREVLPALVERVAATGRQVVWQCDPMHGNTRVSALGYKTRHFDDVVDELEGFFEVHRALGTHPGGVHLEFTGDRVTECLGGPGEVTESDLGGRYESTCDPRLNVDQALELAHRIAELSAKGTSLFR
ncbi:3-deoxy-7-phosphoheptulonate synthase [Streptomyces sp. NBC_01275]|uniref:3-deoxy-7-phosphoheptulonate synthase n=1 Tax=Streptomyces sp. NBC_01275 TaxID=2903807 RepID=UPI00224FBE84|nr:3-deoxy-7-phosphoheptulonate synthase class II [Streptomyces sp. NBC_01275]MCX4761552.1 3-deoxy-7-phosphoheptulonate synthase [Streptomyces sp. NBC_01275]